ncbi:bifunctional diguanylate cyclase/phosphodiesterase [Neomegalonema sp.]|uniref:putative bifunctional diguanylate cyclase/phosphodiesterase n=1 Tax=Neomegalonema sp. TaxID=2039713 RepID=UPI0026109C57|nr:bifunctional diguanylate cyclase/phosphodiesterase [Neomegalonema sp.]MDD2867624.1 bifunctional diguanylate cyclase/phosphodiesterase [Neomegalonema sp.]
MTGTRIDAEDLALALKGLGDAAFVWRLADDRLIWSENAEEALDAPGLARIDTGAALRALLDDEDCRNRDAWLSDPHLRGSLVSEFRWKDCPAGVPPRWTEERLTLVEDSRGPRLVGVLRDASARRARENRLSYLAFFDQTTGHLNRPRLREHLAQVIARTLATHGSAAYLIVGLDNMAGVNDAYGYDVADAVIVQLGARLEKLLRVGDSLGRVAGAKFGVALPDRSRAEVEELVAQMQAAARDPVVRTQAGQVAITVSVGAALLPDHGRATHDAMAAAEEALFRARAQGPNSFMIYESRGGGAELRRRNITMAGQIVTALQENRITLAYQPVVRSDDPKVMAFHECLIRMRDPSGRISAAADFMPVAEQLGLVRMLDRRVLELAFATLRDVPNLRLSINVSPQSALDRDWMRSLRELSEERRDLTERLIVEITEATAIHDGGQTADFITNLRNLGCAMAVDDFGAGYTSFRHFKRLKIDIVKIDGVFVKGVENNPDNRTLVRTLVEIARNFEIMTVAEMVGEAEAKTLRELGVDCLQGYHFGRPELHPAWLRDLDRSRSALGKAEGA